MIYYKLSPRRNHDILLLNQNTGRRGSQAENVSFSGNQTIKPQKAGFQIPFSGVRLTT
ncbi:hypothetical protein ACFFJX_11925 [Pseudarcicella hirudinis]|uniref:hypothetical protein n=1 Tax=Pseudarcicella hirudinis TaxID=1079859 RepID=UPI001C434550|nr:hypothetical protein [Pseudarcicella hirudinis]